MTEGSMKTWGYFDSPEQTVPAFDPGKDVRCPFCNLKLSGRLKAVSLMLEDDLRSYFYRAHAQCYDDATPEAIAAVDGNLIDTIAKARDLN